MATDQQADKRMTLRKAFQAILSDYEGDETSVKRLELDITGSGYAIYRVYPRDGQESERGTVTSAA